MNGKKMAIYGDETGKRRMPIFSLTTRDLVKHNDIRQLSSNGTHATLWRANRLWQRGKNDLAYPIINLHDYSNVYQTWCGSNCCCSRCPSAYPVYQDLNRMLNALKIPAIRAPRYRAKEDQPGARDLNRMTVITFAGTMIGKSTFEQRSHT